MVRTLEEVLDSPAPAGVRWIAKGYLEEWRATLPRLHGATDDEALHDYRVALRKLRSWLRTFDEGGGKVQRQLSQLNEATGAARDLEVMRLWLKEETSPAVAHALERLKGHGEVDLVWLEARTQKLSDRLEEKLSRYTLEVPLGTGAQVIPFSWAYALAVRRQHNELNESALSVGALEDPVLLHRVRIKAKRLRYALVPLKDWPEVNEAVKLLKERQDLLGELHDRHAFATSFARLLADRPAPELALGLEAMTARANREAHELYVRYAQHRHANDVRLAALVDVVSERLGKRMGLHVEVVPQG